MRTTIILFAMLPLFLVSCSTESETTFIEDSIDIQESNNFKGPTLPGGGIDDGTVNDVPILEQADLIAGQNMDAGIVVVTYLDTGEIGVSYEAEGEWQVEATHLFIGDLADLPTNGAGNPKIGQFPYSNVHPSGTTNVTYIGPQIISGDCVYIAAHAVVINSDSGQEETAWAKGEYITNSSWAMTFEVCY